MTHRRLWFKVLRLVAKVLQRLRRHAILGEIYELIDGTIGDYIRDHGLIYAAAVSFYALLSLIPLVVLFASGLGYVLHWLGSENANDMQVVLPEVMHQLRRAIPYLQPEFEKDLRTIVANRQGLGLAGFAALLLASSQVFRALEFAFARIFARKTHRDVMDHVIPRNLVLSKLLFGAFIVALVGVFLVLEIVVTALKRVLVYLPDVVLDGLETPLAGESLFSHLVTAIVMTGGFAILLKLFTTQRVRFAFALLGGVAFWGSWQGSRMAYEIYLDRFADLGAIYGSFATLMVLVLWVFFCSTVLLICGEFVKTVQNRVLNGPRWPKDPLFAPDDDAMS